MQPELISVIIPTYNRAHLILRSVHSVLNQTYQNIELIVVDDGSTDNTLTLLSELADSRVKLVSTDGRRGANFARNLGVSQASGQLIAFQDSDDVWLVDKLERQVEFMHKHTADAVFSSFIKIVGDFIKIMPPVEKRTAMRSKDGLVSTEHCLRGNVLSTQTLLIKKAVFDELKGFDNELRRLQDWDLAIRLIEEYQCYFMDEPFVNVYEQVDSISANPDLAIEAREFFFKKFDGLYKRYPKLHRAILYDYYKLRFKRVFNR